MTAPQEFGRRPRLVFRRRTGGFNRCRCMRAAVVAVQNAISYTLCAAVLRAFVAFLYISEELAELERNEMSQVIIQKMSAETIDGNAWAILKMLENYRLCLFGVCVFFSLFRRERLRKRMSSNFRGFGLGRADLGLCTVFLASWISLRSHRSLSQFSPDAKQARCHMRNKTSQKSNAQASTPSQPPPTTTSGAGTYQILVSFVPIGTPKKVA